MATVKIVLRKKVNKDGSYPLAIRITKDRRSSYISLGHSVKEGDWDAAKERVKKSHPNATRLNNLLLKKKAEANDTLLDLETRGKDASSGAIRRQIKPKGGVSFFAQAGAFIENMRKAGKYNRVCSDEPRINRFKTFLGGEDIAFEEITVPLLQKYRAWLKGTHGIGERTIINHLIIIRTIYNQAISAHIIDNKAYPFGKGKIAIKFPESSKVGLTAAEVKKIEDLALTGDLAHARNVWLFAFSFAGMRISDVLRSRWSDFQDNRLHYTMHKNQKAGSLKIPPKVIAILDQYRDHPPKHDLIFPELKILDNMSDLYTLQRKTSYAVKLINKRMKKVAEMAGITKKLTTHISRHSFASIAGDKISPQVLQLLYRHSSITTTIGYQGNFANDKTDSALDTVLDF